MMGSLAVELASKKIRTFADLFRATVTGDIENVDGVLKITRMNVSYILKVPKEKRKDAREAFEIYLPSCPAAQSVFGCIVINHELTLEDLPAPRDDLNRLSGIFTQSLQFLYQTLTFFLYAFDYLFSLFLGIGVETCGQEKVKRKYLSLKSHTRRMPKAQNSNVG